IPDWRADREAHNYGPTPPAEQLAVAIAILRAIWAAGQERRRLHRDELEREVPGGSAIFTRVLGHLVAAGYVVTTEDERVVIAREISDTTLYDLHTDLGLHIGTDLGGEFNEALGTDGCGRRSWIARLRDTLVGLDRTKRELLNQPLKSYVAWDAAPQERRAAE